MTRPGLRLRPLRTLSHWSLRARLALAATGLALLALVAANAVGLVLLENYLVERVDKNLDMTGGGPVDAVVAQQLVAERLDLAQNGRGGQDEETIVAFLAERFGGDFRMFLYGGDVAGGGGVVGIPSDPQGPGPRLPDRDALAERAGDVFTVPGSPAPTGGSPYRGRELRPEVVAAGCSSSPPSPSPTWPRPPNGCCSSTRW